MKDEVEVFKWRWQTVVSMVVENRGETQHGLHCVAGSLVSNIFSAEERWQKGMGEVP